MERRKEFEMELRESSTKIQKGDAEEEKTLCFRCIICGKSFPFQSSLSQHMRKHTGEKPYKCPYCDHRASQKGNLKIHLRSHRMGTISQGHEVEMGDAQLVEVGASEGLDGCASPTKSTSACNKIMNGSAQLENSKILLRSIKKDPGAAVVLDEEDETPGTYHCNFCKSKFDRKKNLEQHIQQVHKPYKCRLCNYMTLREETLLNHIEKDHITMALPLNNEPYTVNGKSELSAGEFPCEVCGQCFSQAWFLKAHMKKHRGSFDHGCHICGRRFKEPWFLKNHMKSHGPKTGNKNKPKTDSEPIATINNVIQGETIMPGLALYEVCMKCGNLFTNLESLKVHNMVHCRVEDDSAKNKVELIEEGLINGSLDSSRIKQLFLECLNLKPFAGADKVASDQPGKRVAELDPVSSYQAWQLATKGKVAEASEYVKCVGWDEALADADVTYDKDKGEYILTSQEKRKRETDIQSPSNPKKRSCAGISRPEKGFSGHPGENSAEGPSDVDYRAPSRQSRRSSQNKSTECFECGKIFRTYHQMVLHSRVHRKERRSLSESGSAVQHDRYGSASEGETGSASRPSTPGSASAPEDSVASGVGEDGADYSLEVEVPPSLPGDKSYHCNFPGEEVPALTTSVKHCHTIVEQASERDGSVRKPGIQVLPAFSPENHSEGPLVKSSDSLDTKLAILQQNKERPGSNRLPTTTGTVSGMGQTSPVLMTDLQNALGPQNNHLHEKVQGPHIERPLFEKSDDVPEDLVPLDLSQKSSRPDLNNKASTSALQASLIVHQCPYCNHKTYYPEVMWMHKKIWHKISCSSMAPQWIQQNGFKSIKSHLVFMARNGRTGPPPILGGKECQPLPVARFTRTQGSVGLPTSKSNSASAGSTVKPAVVSQARDNHLVGQCGPRSSGLDGYSQPKLNHTQEQCNTAMQQPPLKQRFGELNPKQIQAGSFNRSHSLAHTAMARPSPQPTNSKQVDKYMIPQGSASYASPSNHCPSDTVKAKFNMQPPYHSLCKSDHHTKHESPPVPLRESHTKAMNELRTLANCSTGARTSPQMLSPPSAAGAPPAFHNLKPDSADEGHEKRLDILNIFKTYLPKDLATLYQSWGANNSSFGNAGLLRTQAHQGDYICKECGKSFNQPSHLRTHMRSHTVVFESNGLRGTEVHTTSADAPKQGRDHSNADIVHTVPLRKGT